MLRINKYIASSGVCSRRKAEELILNGAVSLNGKKVSELGVQIDEDKDEVLIHGVKICLEKKKVYIMLNKPRGYITTNDEQFSRPMVLDLIKESIRVFPIGRLDMDTEGLLLLTNDGEFANKMMHPTNKIEKTYVAKVDEKIPEQKLQKLRDGVDIGDYITKPAKVKLSSQNELEIKICEGKNRQVRRMCEALDIILLGLKRTQVDTLKIGMLKTGEYRYLTQKEVNEIKKNYTKNTLQ